MLKHILYYYYRAMWHMSIAKGELNKPLQFSNETIWIATFLAVKGIDVSILNVLIAYLVVFTAMIIIGKMLVKFGVIQYVNSLGNQQSPELMELLERVRRIEDRI